MVTFIERSIGRLQNASSSANTQTLALPREHLYNRLFLRVVFPTATSNNYVAGGEDIAINKIEIIANGQLVLKSYSWLDLVHINKYVNAVANVDKTALTVAKTAGFGSAIIDFSLTRKDLSTMLPSYKFTSLDLKISWDGYATWGGDTGILPYVDVSSRELLFTPEMANIKFAFNKETSISTTPSATGFAEINLPIANVYRRIYLYQAGGASTGAQNATSTDLEVIQDGVIFHKKTTFLENQVKDKQEFHLETKVTGVTMLGFDATGDGEASVDSAPFSSWKLRLNVPDVSNAVTLRIVPQELIYPRG